MGSSNSGYYELQAVLTHQGRSSSSGHYVGWVKHKDSESGEIGLNQWAFGRLGSGDVANVTLGYY